MKEKKNKNRKTWCILIIVVECLVIFAVSASGEVERRQSIKVENINLRKEVKTVKADYEELEEAYKELQKESNRRLEATQTYIFGKVKEDADKYLKIKDDTGTAKKELKKGWKNKISAGVSQLLETRNLGEARSVTLTEKIIFSVSKATAYAASLDDNKECQIVIIYYPYYDEYLYFYQELPKVITENSQETGSGNNEQADSGRDSAVSATPGSVTVVQTTTEQPEQVDQEDTEETMETLPEKKEISVHFVSQKILAYIDQQKLEIQLEQFMRVSGYQGNLACTVQEDFEVDNRNNYVTFTLSVKDMEGIIAGTYDRNTGDYTFDFL